MAGAAKAGNLPSRTQLVYTARPQPSFEGHLLDLLPEQQAQVSRQLSGILADTNFSSESGVISGESDGASHSHCRHYRRKSLTPQRAPEAADPQWYEEHAKKRCKLYKQIALMAAGMTVTPTACPTRLSTLGKKPCSKTCNLCGTTCTPLWRKEGAAILCNKCGLRVMRAQKADGGAYALVPRMHVNATSCGSGAVNSTYARQPAVQSIARRKRCHLGQSLYAGA